MRISVKAMKKGMVRKNAKGQELYSDRIYGERKEYHRKESGKGV